MVKTAILAFLLDIFGKYLILSRFSPK